MISKYITNNHVLEEITEYMPGMWINMTSPTHDESKEISEKFGIDISDLRAPLDDEESSRVDINDGYVLIIFDIPTVEIRHNQEAYTTIPLGVIWTAQMRLLLSNISCRHSLRILQLKNK